MASRYSRPDGGECKLGERLLYRQSGDRLRRAQVRGIYGDKTWVNDLDIVDELDGHSGCVNALSWSKSGRLLASGSDDQHVNIHSYQPDDSNSAFKLYATVSTGHTANIFSVKFMPHSNDRTIVSCAGDHEIRIFDLEYAGRPSTPSAASSRSSARRAQGLLHNGVRYLTDGDSNARIYRSHSDRVKRIVTESSPYLFLSCSEDGEVRQWDLRLPSSAYPPSRRRGFRTDPDDDSSGVPPPLISYKKYQLDLNTISCSPSQPHYIALGGAHLHCFLHDRRMLGRDRVFERAGSTSSAGTSEHDDDLMGEATQCVRKFAPNGQRRMGKDTNGHITACKISDANPNEMIVSWSGDWIYSFDLLRSPDARDSGDYKTSSNADQRKSDRARESSDRKRKRPKAGSTISQEAVARGNSKPRTESGPEPNENRPVTLRVLYENGQSENIPVTGSNTDLEFPPAFLSEAERTSHRIARASVKIRKHMITLGQQRLPTDEDPTGHSASFTSALGFAAAILPEMDEIMRAWRYPVNPSGLDVLLEDSLRRNREAARRFFQACGTLARLLGGKIQTAGSGQSPRAQAFTQIHPAPNEKDIQRQSHQFSLDFLRAITSWLDSGPGALVEAFTRRGPSHSHAPRFPVPPDAGIEAIDEVIVPYLLQLASDRPLINIDASRFETEESRAVFASEKAAVHAFANAVKIPFGDLSGPTESDSLHDTGTSSVDVQAQDRKVAVRFWAFKVGRIVLLNAGESIDYAFVDRAFGGLGRTASTEILREEQTMREQIEEIDPNEEEPLVNSLEIVPAVDDGEEIDDEVMIPIDDVANAIRSYHEGGNDDQDEDDDDEYEETQEDSDAASHEPEDDDESSNEDDAAEDGDGSSARHLLYRSVLSRSSLRTKVQPTIPTSSHTRVYTGHCNVRTVKDVNFYGLNDEYIVSGSDSGHLFIWDKRSSRLLNILEGDGEVVNVVQGHPYEPMLAVSGIDHSIKIFSPDARSRHDARHGFGISAADDTGWSSLRLGGTRFGRRRPARHPSTTGVTFTPEADDPLAAGGTRASDSDSSEDDEISAAAPNGLASRRRIRQQYEITAQNDVDRRGGNREAYITQSMLAQLALRMQARRAAATGDGGGDGGGDIELNMGDEDGQTIVISEDCEIM